MRCVGCEHKVKGKRLEDTGQRCPNCGHAFVADPPTDVFTDVGIRVALARVTADGTASFLSEHLGYELLRGIAARRRRHKRSLIVVTIALLAGIVVAWVLRSGVLLVPIGIGGLMLWGMARAFPHQPDVFALAARYLDVNPSPRRVPRAEAVTEAERCAVPSGLGAAKQILVCQHRQHCDFLLANGFHVHNACPVLGPDGYRADLYPGLVARLAREPAIVAFVVHDYTPAGLAFASAARAVPPWPGRGETVTMLDIGLGPAHRAALARSLRPVGAIPGAAQGPIALPDDLGAELTAVRPAAMLAALATSLETRSPLALARKGDGSVGVDADSE